jgi:hypothetical protein
MADNLLEYRDLAKANSFSFQFGFNFIFKDSDPRLSFCFVGGKSVNTS